MSIKVLTVEDATLIRTIINNTIKMMDGIELVGTAINGKEALVKIKELRPDIITLDLVMPVMDGLETLEELRKFSDIPVIVLSAQTDQETTIRALEGGAQDFLTKPQSITKNRKEFKQNLKVRIKALAKESTRYQSFSSPTKSKHVILPADKQIDAMVIGASTGGPKVISSLIRSLPSTLSFPIFIVQHMPKGFTASFAKRLDTLAAMPVLEAADGLPITKGKVYIAPGGYHMLVENERIRLQDTRKIHGVKPAVDPLFESAVQTFGGKVVGILLTGMGRDGAKGCLAIKDAGGYVLAQDESSCVVYGMPKHAVEVGAVDHVLPIEEIINIIEEIVKD